MKSSKNKRPPTKPAAPKKLTRAEVSQIKSDHHRDVVRPADMARWDAERVERKALLQNPAIHARSAVRWGSLEYETEVDGEAEDVAGLATLNARDALGLAALLFGALAAVGAIAQGRSAA